MKNAPEKKEGIGKAIAFDLPQWTPQEEEAQAEELGREAFDTPVATLESRLG